MNADKVNALIQEAVKSIAMSTDYVDCLFFRDNSLYGFSRKLRASPIGSADSIYEDMRFTSPDPSLTDDEKQAVYNAVLTHIQES